MAKPTQKELSALRANYLAKREALLQKKVSNLSVNLFDRVFDQYLSALEQSGGVILKSKKNISMVQGLDSIYRNFNRADNIPVIRSFVGDLKQIIPLNEKYFKNIAEVNVAAPAARAKLVTDKSLGLTSEGGIIEGGFVDKFISDQTLLKKIKKQTLKAITSGKGFQDFRHELQDIVVGDKQSTGGLHQYYRNYAYDTYQKVDRLNQDVFAKELGLRWFFWSGGLIKNSRALCVKCNGRLIDSVKLRPLKFNDLKLKYRDGLDKNWVPISDLGQHGCHHSKDYVTDAIALKLSKRILDLDELLAA